MVAVDQVVRDGGRRVGVRSGPQYVHVDECLTLKEGASGGDVEESEAG